MVVPPPQPAQKSRLPLILGIVVGVFLLCCGGGAVTLIIASTHGGPLADISLGRPGDRDPSSPAPDTGAASPGVTPSATPSAPAKPATLPADVVYQGRGNKTVKLKPLSPDHDHYVVASHKGSSNFAVWAIDAGGEERDLVINEIGRYEGARPLGLEEAPSALKVEADGSWKITVKVLEKAPAWPRKTSGKGATVLRVDPATAPAGARITHQGRSNFVVQTYGDTPELLVNEIGKYSGEVDIAPGTEVIAIEGNGSWTMKPN